jgi:hypothetical protein
MKKLVYLLFFASLFINGFCQQSQQPIYMRLDTCWKGYFPHKDQYVEYLLTGSSKLQDAYHVLVNPVLGLMITFADKTNFESNIPMLEAHKKWEVDYWRKQVKNITVVDCKDLYEGINNTLVTELGMTSDNPKKTLRSCLIGVAGNDGVFVFAFSSPSVIDHELIKRFVKSIKLIDKPFNPIDLKNEVIRLKNKDDSITRNRTNR